MITIFGYSAPKSDVEALDMMKRAWGKVDDRKLEEIEIIDIKDENEALFFIFTCNVSKTDL